MKAILMGIFLALCVTVLGQEQVKSFRGWDWGKSFDEVSGQLTPAKTKTTLGMKPFYKIDEEKVFEGIEVDNIIYLFKNNKFVAATVAMHNDNLDKILEIFTEKYGETTATNAFVLTNYEWHIPTADIAITHIPTATDGIGVSVQIKGK